MPLSASRFASGLAFDERSFRRASLTTLTIGVEGSWPLVRTFRAKLPQPMRGVRQQRRCCIGRALRIGQAGATRAPPKPETLREEQDTGSDGRIIGC